jgi:hypothetical protein
MKTRTKVTLGMGLSLFVIAGALWPVIDVALSRSERYLAVSGSYSSLTEELAVEKAQEALAQDGLTVADWHPRRHSNATAPDLMMDRFDDKSGLLFFTNPVQRTRIVLVRLEDGRVFCQTSKAK